MDIAQSRPRFRTDLVAAPFHEGGERFIDVTDPASGKTFRFYEIEFSIACAMDGQRDLSSLVDWARSELGLATSRDELQSVVSTLSELGYLESGARAAAPASPASSAGGGFDLGLPGAGSEPELEVEVATSSSGNDEFELGLAGKSMFDNDDDERLDAPDLTLGVSGNETLSNEPDELPPGALSPQLGDDEVPTTIKRADGIAEPLDQRLAEPPEAPSEPTKVQPTLRPVGRASTADDGPTNIPPPATEFDEEVSVDLTDHMRIDAADVKEAVRQSKVIQAVAPPQQMVEGMAANKGRVGTEDEESAAATTEREAPRLQPPPSPRLESAPSMDEDIPTTELPDQPVSVSKPSATIPAVSASDAEPDADSEAVTPSAPPRKSRAGVLLILLVLAAVGAGAYYYYNEIWLPAQQAAEVPVMAPADAAPVEPPPPEPPVATLAAVPVDPVEVTAPDEGRVEEILASGTEVEADEVVVKLDGYERYQRRLDDALSDIERYRKRIAASEEKKQAAEDAGSESGMERYQRYIERDLRKIEDREEQAAEAREGMAPYVLRAPITGTVATEIEEDARLDAEQLVFLIELPPVLQARFTIDERGEIPPQDTDVELTGVEDEAKSGTCAVVEVDAEERSVLVTCPSDGALSDGDEVVLSVASE